MFGWFKKKEKKDKPNYGDIKGEYHWTTEYLYNAEYGIEFKNGKTASFKFNNIKSSELNSYMLPCGQLVSENEVVYERDEVFSWKKTFSQPSKIIKVIAYEKFLYYSWYPEYKKEEIHLSPENLKKFPEGEIKK